MRSFRVAEVLLRLNVTSSLTTLGQLTLQDNNNANALTSDLPLFNFRYLLALLWGSTRESLLVHFFFYLKALSNLFQNICYGYSCFVYSTPCFFLSGSYKLYIYVYIWLYEVKVHYYVYISASLFLFRYAPLSFSNCFLTSKMTLICVLTSSKTTLFFSMGEKIIEKCRPGTNVEILKSASDI